MKWKHEKVCFIESLQGQKVPGVEETLTYGNVFAFIYLVNLSVYVKFSLSVSVFVKDDSS